MLYHITIPHSSFTCVRSGQVSPSWSFIVSVPTIPFYIMSIDRKCFFSSQMSPLNSNFNIIPFQSFIWYTWVWSGLQGFNLVSPGSLLFQKLEGTIVSIIIIITIITRSIWTMYSYQNIIFPTFEFFFVFKQTSILEQNPFSKNKFTQNSSKFNNYNKRCLSTIIITLKIHNLTSHSIENRSSTKLLNKLLNYKKVVLFSPLKTILKTIFYWFTLDSLYII